MSAFKVSFLFASTAIVVTTVPLRASALLGTQVSGALYISGYPQNQFDPVNGWVPTGYLNHAGTTVTIASNAVEFGYFDGTTTIAADFGDTQLSVSFIPQIPGNYRAMQLAFTNSAFSNLSVVSDTFPSGGLTSSLSGGVITLSWGGSYLDSNQTVQAIFNLNLPAPPTLSIQLAPTNAVVISWPVDSASFTLQQNGSFNPANWVNITNAPAVTNGQNQVILSPPVGTQFYRLKYP